MVAFMLNGTDVDVDVPNDSPLLYVLNFDLNDIGPKYGCGRSQCGSCTVLIDGDPVRSCDVSVSAAAGRSVTSLRGLREADGSPGPLQRAFIEEQAAQCGFCTSGAMLQAQAILDRNPNPSESEVRSGLNEILCRCGTHNRIIRAVLRAAEEA